MPRCNCAKDFHPQPVSYDKSGRLVPLHHKCAVCGQQWPYGSREPACLGPGVA